MNIAPRKVQQEIKLEYETDQFRFTGQLQSEKYVEEEWKTVVDSIDALAQITAEVVFSERACIDSTRFTTAWHHVDARLYDDLQIDGRYKQRGNPFEEYRLTNFMGDFDKEKEEWDVRYEALARNLATMCRDQFPGYNVAINIKVHSEPLYQQTTNTDERQALVGPYCIELVDRAIMDAKKMIGGQTP